MNQMDQSVSLRITTLNDIKLKFELVFLHLSLLFHQIKHCTDFNQVQMAVCEHLKQALSYINQCIIRMQKHHSQFELKPLSLADLASLYTNAILQKVPQSYVVTLDSIETQLRQLTIQFDLLVFIIRDCPSVEKKPHVLLLARAMTELFQLQHIYIYPYRADLVPDFLNKIDFADKVLNDAQ